MHPVGTDRTETETRASATPDRHNGSGNPALTVPKVRASMTAAVTARPPAESTDDRFVAGDRFDVAIVGAGVIGCALARRFTLDGARVLVVEKAVDILDGASKANSAILHTGFDAPPDTLEAACVRRGRAAYLAMHASLGLPLIPCGALVLAWSEDEVARLPALIDKARRNGVDDVELLTSSAIARLEPDLSPTVKAGFRVPGESLIDAWSAPHAYLSQAVANGAELRRECEVLDGTFDGETWALNTSLGRVNADFVINAAGLYGDRVDARLIGRSDFEIRPRKGQFIVYDKPAANLATHILLPVPNEVTKGIVVCRTAYGNLLVGPTAEEQDARDLAELVPTTLRALQQRGEEILPGLADHDVTAMYAGLRPATDDSRYRVTAHDSIRYITVGGIRSTGLSSALGLAEHVAELAIGMGSVHRPLEAPQCPRVANISECATRDWQSSGNGGIVCHCESVTRREIEAALDSPLAPRSLAGLKRRTRVTLGRCQGFHCSAALAELTEGRLARPMARRIDDD